MGAVALIENRYLLKVSSMCFHPADAGLQCRSPKTWALWEDWCQQDDPSGQKKEEEKKMIPQTISNNEEHGCDDNDCWWWRRWEMWQLEKVKLRGKNWNSCFYIQVRQETAVSEEVEDSRPASSSSKDSSSLPSARSNSSFFPSLDIPSQTTPPVFSSPPSHPSRPSTATRHYKIHPSSGESAFGKFVIFIFFLPPKIPHPGLHQDQSHPVHHQSLKGLDRAGAPNHVLQCDVEIPFNTDSKKHHTLHCLPSLQEWCNSSVCVH